MQQILADDDRWFLYHKIIVLAFMSLAIVGFFIHEYFCIPSRTKNRKVTRREVEEGKQPLLSDHDR